MAILIKKKNNKVYQQGGKSETKKPGDLGKDAQGATRLAPGGFGKPKTVSMKDEKKKQKAEKKAARKKKKLIQKK